MTFDLDLDLEHILEAHWPGVHLVKVWWRSDHLPARRSDLRKSLQTDRQTDRWRTPRHCISSFLEWANKNVKSNGVLSRNCQIHGEFTVIPFSKNMFVAIMVVIMVCGRHGHCLWPSWLVAVMVVAVMVCGHHCRTSFQSYNSLRRKQQQQQQIMKKQMSKKLRRPWCGPEWAGEWAAQLTSVVCVVLTWHCVVTMTYYRDHWSYHWKSQSRYHYCRHDPECVPPSSVASAPAPRASDIPAAGTTETAKYPK